jgi:twitching motility protein PilT
MARVDRILSILVQQGATELRLGTDREPRLLSHGAAKRLSIPSTPEETLRELLGEILDAQREEALRTRGRAELSYDVPGLGTFQVHLAARQGGGFDAIFVRDESGRAVPSPDHGLAAAISPAAPIREERRQPQAVETSPRAQGSEASSALAEILATATALRASDLHLTEGQPPVARVDGRLRRLGDTPVGGDAFGLSPDHLDAIARGQSIDAAIDRPGGGRARLHAFRTAEGLAAAVRLLPASAPSLASLNLPVPLHDLVHLPHGLVLVCGATGSGKSTTLAALAQEALERRSIALVTLEDPIEHGLAAPEGTLVRRREVRRDVPDFAAGLRDALREDPDVILLGEMRDPETIGLALTAAETGHLVLSSLHSRSAASAIERIVDAYAPARQQQIRVQLADSLRAVVSQRLVARARGSGRIPALEVLRVTHAVAALVREGKTAQIATAIQSGRREGMITLERCLADRVLAGEIKIEDARAAANDVESLTMYLAK